MQLFNKVSCHLGKLREAGLFTDCDSIEKELQPVVEKFTSADNS